MVKSLSRQIKKGLKTVSLVEAVTINFVFPSTLKYCFFRHPSFTWQIRIGNRDKGNHVWKFVTGKKGHLVRRDILEKRCFKCPNWCPTTVLSKPENMHGQAQKRVFPALVVNWIKANQLLHYFSRIFNKLMCDHQNAKYCLRLDDFLDGCQEQNDTIKDFLDGDKHNCL